MAPASHIDSTILKMVNSNQPSYQLSYTMFVLQSFASNHSDIHLNKILTPKALSHLDETMHHCITDISSKGYWTYAIPRNQFLSKPDIGPVLKVATENNPGYLILNYPTLIVQGIKDSTVRLKWTNTVVHDLCKHSNWILYWRYPDATHETIPDQSNADVSAWVDARFRGDRTKTNCATLQNT
jgi:hypothetical protein